MKWKNIAAGLLLTLQGITMPLTAQQSISLDNVNSYIAFNRPSNCALPMNMSFGVMAYGTGYLQTDSCTLFADYGDGQQSVTRQTMNYPTSTGWSTYCFLTHTYSTSGLYTFTIIVSDDFGHSDTLRFNNAVTSSTGCEASLRTFIDYNQNCIYDGTDTLFTAMSWKCWSNDPRIYQYATPNSGIFNIGTISGETYHLSASAYFFNSGISQLQSCLQNDTIHFVASSYDTIDVPLHNNKQIIPTQIGDTIGSYCRIPASSFHRIRFAGYLFDQGDTVNVHVYFGDGQDTLVSFILQQLTFPFTDGNFGISHIYPFTGTYVPMYIVTDNFGFSDTLYPAAITVSDTCGTITGRVFADANANCSFDNNELSFPNHQVKLYQNNQLVEIDFANPAGWYAFDVAPGNYHVVIDPYPVYSLTCNSSDSVAVTAVQSQTVQHDFGLVCNSPTAADAWPQVWGTLFRPGGQISYLYPSISSINCTSFSGTATLILDPLTTYIGSCDTSFQPQQNGNVLTWNFNALSNTSLMLLSGYCLQLQTSTSAQIGDTVCFRFIINAAPQDTNPQNDTIDVCYPIRNSWDPNMKEVWSPQGIGGNGEIQQNTSLTYTVHFQNTGNDVAYNISITDTLDNHLDMATLEILGSSHNMMADMPALGVLRFDFPGINLPDSTSDEPHSHGWVRYRINTIPNQPMGTQITNTAFIFFDINPAIVTNTTVNTIAIPGGVQEAEINSFTLFPVPASNQLTVQFSSAFDGTLSIVDLWGRVLISEKISGTKTDLMLKEFSAGTYMLRCTATSGMSYSRMFTISH